LRASLLAALTGIGLLAGTGLAIIIGRGGEYETRAAASREPGRTLDFRLFHDGLLIADSTDRFDRAMRFLAAIMSIEERRTAAALTWLAAQEPAAPAPATAARPAPATAPRATVASVPIGQRLLDLINARRSSAGLAPVATNARLSGVATSFAQQLLDTGTVSHTAPDGSTIGDRLAAAGFAGSYGGEVIAWGTAGWDPESIVQAWMNSAHHRTVILSASLSVAGAACASDGIEMRCVVDFAG
jgi:uncharacterized protein YkwD